MKMVKPSGDVFEICNEGIALYFSRAWYKNRKYVSNSSGKYFHRELMGNPPCDIDHKDINGFNNRKSNLRLATRSQNCGNTRKRTGKFKGASFDKWAGRWKADIKKDGKAYYLGRHDTEEEAALVYNEKAIELFGEFANLNEV